MTGVALARRCGRFASLAATVAALVASVGCGQNAAQEDLSAPLQITWAIQGAPYSGLIAVADEKGFFRKAGIEVKIALHPSGGDALKALRRGEAEFATAADIAFAAAMDEDPSLRVIAAIGASSGSEIVARKDRNIHKPADLRGKRIGYSPGTSSPYFLRSFLLTHHISPQDITAVEVPSARQAEAIVSGDVDAVSAFEVYAFVARKQLGENAVAWESQNTIDYQWLLVTRTSLTPYPKAARRLLKGLIAAEEFVVNHEKEAKAIIARKWHIDPELLDYSWNRTRRFVSFNQSIITGLQSYARWDMRAEGRTGKPLDVGSYLDTGPLDEVDPRLVTVFR